MKTGESINEFISKASRSIFLEISLLLLGIFIYRVSHFYPFLRHFLLVKLVRQAVFTCNNFLF